MNGHIRLSSSLLGIFKCRIILLENELIKSCRSHRVFFNLCDKHLCVISGWWFYVVSGLIRSFLQFRYVLYCVCITCMILTDCLHVGLILMGKVVSLVWWTLQVLFVIISRNRSFRFRREKRTLEDYLFFSHIDNYKPTKKKERQFWYNG